MGGATKASVEIASDMVEVGQTIQFHLRDAQTAREDLALLLDGQRLYDPPAGALVFSCNGRGEKLFGPGGHDASACAAEPLAR